MTDGNTVHVIADDEQSRSGTAPERPPSTLARLRRPRRYLRFGFLALALVAVLLIAGRWMHYRSLHVSTDDSRIAAREVTVSSEVAGRLTAVEVLAGDHVAAGDLLVGIDTDQSELELAAARAEVAQIEAEISQLRAEQTMIGAQIESRLRAGQAELAASEAEHHVSEAVLDNVQRDYERAESLYKQNLIASHLHDDARENLISAQQRELRAAADVETARAHLEVIRSEESRIAVLDRQIAALEAGKAVREAELARQRIDLARREIRAGFDGVIDQTFVDAGEYVSPGRRLLMYHDPNAVWVDANFRETEFRRLARGASATITVDAYPDREFHGKVVRLGQAATSEFALLPSPNPSGNFTKVAQRLPVRISIAQVNGLLRPGMMVEVTVDVAD